MKDSSAAPQEPYVVEQARLSSWMKSNNNNIVTEDLRGTFKDNMKAPIHRWFRYSAGFSYNLVEEVFRKYKIGRGSIVLDPFAGVGTTCVSSKKLQVESIGKEAHPLVAWIAQVKIRWDFDFSMLKKTIDQILFESSMVIAEAPAIDTTRKPKLLQNSFSEQKLSQLYALKEYLIKISDEKVRDLCILALLSTLRKVSKAHTGWPYILPKKERKNVPELFPTFQTQLKSMVFDLETVTNKDNKNTAAKIVCGDARELSKYVQKPIGFAFTSPPYLNNFDFADRTRLELYFLSPIRLGDVSFNISTWNDVTRHIRQKLLVNVTHQAVEIGLKEGLQPNSEIVSSVREKLIEIAIKLREEKSLHGGHKDYDIMIVAYFNDMWKTFKEVYDVMKNGSHYLLILGDSAPYGIHVPTDVFLAEVACGIGFSSYKILDLRTRGDKWVSAPKHRVPLKESMIILKK